MDACTFNCNILTEMKFEHFTTVVPRLGEKNFKSDELIHYLMREIMA